MHKLNAESPNLVFIGDVSKRAHTENMSDKQTNTRVTNGGEAGSTIGTAVERFGIEWVEVPLAIQREKMALSKMSEALVGGSVVGEGATLDQFLRAQKNVATIINGGFFYYAKMEQAYGVKPPPGKRVGDGIGRFKIRGYSSEEPDDRAAWGPGWEDVACLHPIQLAGSFRQGWLVQEKRGESFRLVANLPGVMPPAMVDHKYILTCSPLLLVDGYPTPNPQYGEERTEVKGPPGHLGHLTQLNHRSMIGQRADGTLVLAASKKPMVFDDMQEVMMELGCQTAMGLDGGGSSFLWHEGERKVQGDGERLVGNAIVVFR